MSSKPVDIQARQQAIDPLSSYCVTAPAGSGKTELLTQRFLNLLGRVDKPEQVLALTFTRKAAAEMRERILESIQRAANGGLPQQTHKQLTFELAQQVLKNSENKGWGLLEYPMRLKIQTIDSLCQSIVKDQPLLSGAGGHLQPVDDASRLYNAAIDNLFNELDRSGGEQHALGESLSRLLYFVDNRVDHLRDLLADMLPFRDQWLGHAGTFKVSDDRKKQLEAILSKRIAQALALARQELLPFQAQLIAAGTFAAEHIVQLDEDTATTELIASLDGLASLPQPEQGAFKQWQALLELLFTKELKPRSRLVSKQGFPPKKFFGKQGERAELAQAHKDALMSVARKLSESEEKMRLFKTLVSLPLSGYASDQLTLLDAMVDCLFRLVAHLKLVFMQEGRCDHLEVSSLALQALGDQSSLPDQGPDDGVAYRWSEKFHHILVDEFQDTSISQFELLKALSCEWSSYNALNAQSPKTIFVVGDGMQSVYSFRAAKVGLFLTVRDQGVGDLPFKSLYLKQNFRSKAAIVNWVNQHFERAFPQTNEQNAGAVSFEAAVATFDTAANITSKTSDTNINVNSAVGVSTQIIVLPQSETETLVDPSLIEAQKIAALIKSRQEEDPTRDIAILVRARSHFTAILAELDAQGIVWEGVDIDELSARESIMDCMTLTRALLNPVDDIAWYALLRSPLGGMKLSDLQLLADYVASDNCERCLSMLLTDATLCRQTFCADEFSSANEYDRFIYLASALEGIQRSRGHYVLSDWLLLSWQKLGGNQVAVNAHSGDESDAVKDYFDLIESLCQAADQGSNIVTYADIERHVDRLYASSGSKTGVTGELTDSVSPVKLMTMHKSKGLEFDTVILPQLHRASANENAPLLVSNEYLFDDGSAGLLLYPRDKREMLERDNRGKSNTLYDHLQAERKYARELESTRLFYVAATRAKRELVLTACLPANDQPNDEALLVKAPNRRSLLARLWPSLQDDADIVYTEITNFADNLVELDTDFGETVDSTLADSTAIIRTRVDDIKSTEVRIKRFDDETMRAIHKLLTPKQSQVNVGRADDVVSSNLEASMTTSSEGDSQDRKSAIALGLLVHEFLELVGQDGLECWRNRELHALLPSWRMRLEQLGATSSQLDRQLVRMRQVFLTVLSSKHCAWLFDSTHTKTDNEWRLVVQQESGSEQLVIDRSFIDNNGQRWIVDYKSSEPDDQQPIRGFLDQQVEQYRAQLDKYRYAVGVFDQREHPEISTPRCALYFPLIDQLVELQGG